MIHTDGTRTVANAPGVTDNNLTITSRAFGNYSPSADIDRSLSNGHYSPDPNSPVTGESFRIMRVHGRLTHLPGPGWNDINEEVREATSVG